MLRQGEWFFTPEPNLVVDAKYILHNEKLVRAGGGKPHLVEELTRKGGETMHVNRFYALYRGGVPHSAYAELPQTTRNLPGWEIMRRNPQAFARGTVRHADHSTVRLVGWHRIHLNGEIRTRSLGFLD